MSREVIIKKINLIKVDVEKLKSLNITSIKQLEDFKNYHTVERLIEKIVDCAIDINQYILREHFEKVIDTGKQSFIELTKKDIIPVKFGEEISKSVKLRNMIIHDYGDLDDKILFNAIELTIKQFDHYCNHIINWV